MVVVIDHKSTISPKLNERREENFNITVVVQRNEPLVSFHVKNTYVDPNKCSIVSGFSLLFFFRSFMCEGMGRVSEKEREKKREKRSHFVINKVYGMYKND